jgi:hypothetical protein
MTIWNTICEDDDLEDLDNIIPLHKISVVRGQIRHWMNMKLFGVCECKKNCRTYKDLELTGFAHDIGMRIFVFKTLNE